MFILYFFFWEMMILAFFPNKIPCSSRCSQSPVEMALESDITIHIWHDVLFQFQIVTKEGFEVESLCVVHITFTSSPAYKLCCNGQTSFC